MDDAHPSAARTVDLGAVEARGVADPDAADLIDTAVRRLIRLLVTNPVAVAWSGGKDSTAVLIATLLAAARLNATGSSHYPIAVLHGDTGVENPVVQDLAMRMLRDLARFANQAGIPLLIDVYGPALNQCFAVKVLSGQQLPTYPHHRHRACSYNWKIEPATRALRRLPERMRRLVDSDLPGAALARAHVEAHGMTPLVTVIGTRFSESVRRRHNMKSRGESAEDVIDHNGRLMLAPIADWTADDVWELIARSGLGRELRVWRADFDDLAQLYRDATGECPIVAAMRSQGREGCGARFGCHACLAVGDDRSLAQMAGDPRYAHLRPLLAIRDWLAAIAFDWTKRSWIGRGVRLIDGVPHVKIQPDGLHPEVCRRLIGAYLAADRDEYRRTDGHPTFQVFDPQKLIALDFYFALMGHTDRPFEILELHDRVWRGGETPRLPALSASRSFAPLPPARWLPLGIPRGVGLSDPVGAAMAELCPVPRTDTPMGVSLANTGKSFDVDGEAAWWVLHHHYRDHLKGERDRAPGGDPSTRTLNGYLELGVVQLSRSALRRLDEAAAWRQAVKAAGWRAMDPARLYGLAEPLGGESEYELGEI